MTFRTQSYDLIPGGTHDAICGEIESGRNEYGAFRKWHFKVMTPTGERVLTAMSSEASGHSSKSYRWATAILGRRPRPDVDEQLEGLACRVHVVVTKDGYNRIEEVLPAKQHGSVNLERLDGQVFGHNAEQTETPF